MCPKHMVQNEMANLLVHGSQLLLALLLQEISFSTRDTATPAYLFMAANSFLPFSSRAIYSCSKKKKKSVVNHQCPVMCSMTVQTEIEGGGYIHTDAPYDWGCTY